jgi:acyl carrier protein
VLIADQPGVDVRGVADRSNFARDFGFGWLNRLQLVMSVEDWTGLELHDDDVEQINCIGDLISLFESAGTRPSPMND